MGELTRSRKKPSNMEWVSNKWGSKLAEKLLDKRKDMMLEVTKVVKER